MKLGRLPHDPARLAKTPKHLFGVSMPPTTLDRSAIPFSPGLYSNNILSDCTCVALANAARAHAAVEGFDLYVAPAKVIAFYSQCAGNPASLVTVPGLVVMDVLNRESHIGFDTGHDLLFGIPGVVDHMLRADLAQSIATFSAGYWGVMLHQRDMNNVGSLWDTGDGADDGPVVGGHAVIAWDYTGLADTDTVRIGTWGIFQRATWRWAAARIEEAYGLQWPQLQKVTT